MCWRVTIVGTQIRHIQNSNAEEIKRLLHLLLFPSSKGIWYAIEPCYDESKYGTYLQYLFIYILIRIISSFSIL